jgi:hypothetical protein
MRRFVAAAGIATILLGLASCTGDDPEIVDKAEEPGGSSTTAKGGSSSTTQSERAVVGDSLTVEDQDGIEMTVTLVEVLDPAPPADEFSAPKDGSRFVGVRMRIRNDGPGVLDESPDNDLELIDGKGQRYSTSLDGIEGCQDFPGSVRLREGDEALGCVSFEVPTSEAPVRIQFTPSSGFADDTAEWAIS